VSLNILWHAPYNVEGRWIPLSLLSHVTDSNQLATLSHFAPSSIHFPQLGPISHAIHQLIMWLVSINEHDMCEGSDGIGSQMGNW
jgi:hypothetical protein